MNKISFKKTKTIETKLSYITYIYAGVHIYKNVYNRNGRVSQLTYLAVFFVFLTFALCFSRDSRRHPSARFGSLCLHSGGDMRQNQDMTRDCFN